MDASSVDAGAPDAAELPDAGAPDAAEVPDAGAPVLRNYLAFGSSSTYGTGASTPDKAYVELLYARLKGQAPTLVRSNFAGGGATVRQFEARLPDMVRLAPEVVTILPYTDYVQTSTETLRAGYAHIFDALGPLGTTIFFGDNTVDPALVCGTGSGPGGCYSPADLTKLALKHDVITALAATRPFVIMVPLLDQNVAHPEWYANSHPNDLGHLWLADQFWAKIQPWLAGR